MTFFEELKWRGLHHDHIPGTQELLQKEKIGLYCGFDPTSDSLHIGNLVPIIVLKHFQLQGHTPFVLVGGATGMIGDPSGKSKERNLLDLDTLRHNEKGIEAQLRRFLNFDEGSNKAQVVNNYDWFKDMKFLDFIRDAGKHITVNYMMAKDSVQKRLETGMSFTEFTYQLIQGYDFFHLWKNCNVKLQAAGSDQWGNIVTGTELIRRIGGGEAYAYTAPLITKADGTKFGKSEAGNVWLDASKTSPFQFYQYWLNSSDADAANYIKLFTFLPKEKIETIQAEHNQDASKRLLQKCLAAEVTTMVHGVEALHAAITTTEKLFTGSSFDSLSIEDFLEHMQGVPSYNYASQKITEAETWVNALAETGIFASKSEARKMIQGGGVSINKIKLTEITATIQPQDVLHEKYIVVQKGKNKNFLIVLK